MSEIKRLQPAARYSEGSIHSGTVYLAGQVAVGGGASIDALLAQAGSSRSRILMAQIYLADMADYAGLNAVWDRWVDKSSAPSRATVEARLAKPEWKIEIVVTAAV